jgi:hypothetical protein
MNLKQSKNQRTSTTIKHTTTTICDEPNNTIAEPSKPTKLDLTTTNKSNHLITIPAAAVVEKQPLGCETHLGNHGGIVKTAGSITQPLNQSYIVMTDLY